MSVEEENIPEDFEMTEEEKEIERLFETADELMINQQNFDAAVTLPPITVAARHIRKHPPARRGEHRRAQQRRPLHQENRARLLLPRPPALRESPRSKLPS